MFKDLFFLTMIFLACGLINPDNACAGYLDPGAGSSFIQGVIAIFVAIRRFFLKLFGIKS